MAKKVIEVKNLCKQYGDLTAVNDVSFSVYKGEVFGLLGENGAGKTTTLEIIEGLRRPGSGQVMVDGHNASTEIGFIKEKIGVQLQSTAYYNFLNLREILELFGSFYERSLGATELLEMVDLADKERSFINKLSGGQKQRFSIVSSLVNDPKIVFLDEPTTGLDPVARRNLWGLITKIKESGKTIVLTTHYLEEAEVLCDRVAIMEKGKILVMDQTHKLIDGMTNPYKINFALPKAKKEVVADLEQLGEVKKELKEGNYQVRFKDRKALNKALNLIIPLNPESLSVDQASLEDFFIELTGKTIEN